MNWLNINTKDMKHPLMVKSDAVQRGSWLSMVCYCTELETDGIIIGARLWTDREWMHSTGLLALEVGDSSLWKWIGDDLHLELYPHDLQAGVISRREGGRKGGQATSEAKSAAAKVNGNAEKAKLKPSLSQGEAKLKPTKRKEMERKEKELEGTLSYQSALADEREREWEKVWSAFPKRIDEKKARAVYLESDVSPQRLIDSLADWSQTDEWTRDSGRWIPLPTKWLERGGWNETPTQIASKQKEPVRCTL
jgi:hypothetical protein